MSNDFKWIERKSVAPIEPATGAVSDTLNVADKVKNAPSINLVQQMTGIPQDGVIAFDGDVIPEGYEEVENLNLEVYSTEEVKTGETWIDGKPIYRTVRPFVTSSVLMNVPLAIPNLERIVDFTGSADFFPINFATLDENGKVFFVSTQYRPRTDNIIHWCSREYAGLQAYAIIKYTKTTD